MLAADNIRVVVRRVVIGPLICRRGDGVTVRDQTFKLPTGWVVAKIDDPFCIILRILGNWDVVISSLVNCTSTYLLRFITFFILWLINTRL